MFGGVQLLGCSCMGMLYVYNYAGGIYIMLTPTNSSNTFDKTTFDKTTSDEPTPDRTTPNEANLDTNIPVLSASRLQSFLDCPRRFALRYLLQYPIEPHPSTVVGTAVHRTLERRWKEWLRDQRDVESIEQVYAEEVARALQQREDTLQTQASLYGSDMVIVRSCVSVTDTMYEEGLRMCLNYDLSAHTPPRFIEYEFLEPYPDKNNPLCYLKGVFDYVYDDGVVDLKTTRKVPSEEELSGNIQLIVYAWAFEKIFGHSPSYVRWYHLRTGRYISYRSGQESIMSHAIDRLVSFLKDVEARGLQALSVYTQPCTWCATPLLCSSLAYRSTTTTPSVVIVDSTEE